MLSNGVTSRAYHRPQPAPRLYEEDSGDEDEDSTDEYGSCSEAPLYENVLDDDEDDDDEPDEQGGVYENVVFEPPAYSNLVRGEEDPDEGQVYANVNLGLSEQPTYDVPTRRPGPQPQQPQEYANLPNGAGSVSTAPPPPPSSGGLGVILEESESSSARSSSGSSGRGSSCTSAASSLARSSTGSSPSPSQAQRTSAAGGLSSLLSRIRGGALSQQQQQLVSVTDKQQERQQDAAVTRITTTTTTFTSLREQQVRDSDRHGDSRDSRGSRDSGLHDLGADWSFRSTETSPRTSLSGDLVQQATPERLARVQQQVRQHMEASTEAESHYQRPRPRPVATGTGTGTGHEPVSSKLSVRDLLGQFEARRAGRALGADSGGPGGVAAGPAGPRGGANSTGAPPAGAHLRHEPAARSYGFGSSTKTALRKVVSEADADGSRARHSNNQSYLNSSGTGTGHGPPAAAAAGGQRSPATTASASTVVVTVAPPATAASANINNNSNAVNNKVASSASSRRSFLDSIIAGAASADGSGRRTSRRASMEEVNNQLNQDNRTNNPVERDDWPQQRNGQPAARALRKTEAGGGSRGGRRSSEDAVDAPVNGAGAERTRPTPLTPPSTPPPPLPVASTATTTMTSASPSENGSVQDIPSIVDQLPDDDRPQEARRTTSGWDPTALVAALYAVPEPLRDKPRPVDRVNVEGFLERLPGGRTKATFWNAWKRCYFRAKDGLLYCYAGKHSDKPMDVTHLMGGVVEPFESMVITAQDRNPATVPVIGVDDRMGHYLVVRAGTPQETDRWVRALQTHTVEDFCSTYVQPWPVPRAPALLRDSIVVDLGSRSVRAGILCTQPSLPQVFFPAVCAARRGLGGVLAKAKHADGRVYGPAALQPGVRATSNLSYPVRPAERINKHTVDLGAVSGFLRVVFQSLAVDPRDYGVVLSVPRALDAATQTRLVAELFDRFGVRSVLLSHQTVLALYAYNAASGVVVDVGERTDVVPIMDGYIVEGGVSRVPYGGEEMAGHVRRFLLQRAPPVSLGTVAEALLPRLALERLCFVSASYRADLKRCQRDPTELAASVSVSEFFAGDKEPTMESLTLDAGRFQAPEGLFHPQAWGLDHPGVHRMVHKAIQECSMDARKTMARSVFLAGGLTMLPGFAERLREELAALLPPAVQPKVHASPYRYHAAYLGACVLANSSGVQEMSLTRDEFNRDGGKLLRPWIL